MRNIGLFIWGMVLAFTVIVTDFQKVPLLFIFVVIGMGIIAGAVLFTAGIILDQKGKSYKLDKIPINTQDAFSGDSVCTICNTAFDMEEEGGISGVIGTFITLTLCPNCLGGIEDLFEQLHCKDCELKQDDNDEWIPVSPDFDPFMWRVILCDDGEEVYAGFSTPDGWYKCTTAGIIAYRQPLLWKPLTDNPERLKDIKT